MSILWTRDRLTRRIDRCYLIAAWTKTAAKRDAYLRLAHYYRGRLARMSAQTRSPELAAA